MKENIAAGSKTPRAKGSTEPLGVNSEIGRKLKQYYDDLVSPEVPDRFSQLLRELEKAETTRKRD
jgi:hypothetical protein